MNVILTKYLSFAIADDKFNTYIPSCRKAPFGSRCGGIKFILL